MILISGYLDGEGGDHDDDNPVELRVEVETMQFANLGHATESYGSAESPAKRKFGIPREYVSIFLRSRSLFDSIQRQ